MDERSAVNGLRSTRRIDNTLSIAISVSDSAGTAVANSATDYACTLWHAGRHVPHKTSHSSNLSLNKPVNKARFTPSQTGVCIGIRRVGVGVFYARRCDMRGARSVTLWLAVCDVSTGVFGARAQLRCVSQCHISQFAAIAD